MNGVKTNVRIVSSGGGDFASFFEIEDLYSKLSGVKDTFGENMEFVEIGKNIQLNNDILKVIDINLKFENINLQIKHSDKSESSTPNDLRIEVVITVEFIK